DRELQIRSGAHVRDHSAADPMTTIALTPSVPLWLLVILAALAATLVGYGLWRGARGTLWRAIPLVALLVALADPILVHENRTPLSDVAVMVVDETGSQKIGHRSE